MNPDLIVLHCNSGGPHENTPGESLLPLTREEDTGFMLQQAALYTIIQHTKEGTMLNK